MSYIKQNFQVLATICKRSHVDNLNAAPIGSFGVRIEIKKLYFVTLISVSKNYVTLNCGGFKITVYNFLVLRVFYSLALNMLSLIIIHAMNHPTADRGKLT